MKTKLALLSCICILTVLSSCKKDKNVYAEDFSVSIDENPSDNQLLGTISARTEKSYLSYTLISESVEGALSLDEATGDLRVKDKSLFNYEINPVITAEVEASNGKRDDISKVTITLLDVYEAPANIGDYRDGGVVFWVDPADNTKGMVCAINDQASSSAGWGCYDAVNPVTINGADGTAIGTGAQNTADIVAGCTSSGIAADVCTNLTLNGYSDWFLPSKDEMNEIYQNKATVNATATANGGSNLDESVLYWTSSEFDAQNAYDFYFFNGASQSSLKLNVFSVRAVRAF